MAEYGLREAPAGGSSVKMLAKRDHILDANQRKVPIVTKGGIIPKLHGWCTGASTMNRMRLRSKAARYNGNIKGPKHSTKSGRDEAGWNGVKVGLGVSNTIASLKARFRCPSGLSPGRNRRLVGESRGDSGAVSGLPILKAFQYSDKACVSDMFAAYFLSNEFSVSLKVR
jgi:hypothetical protein